MRCGRQSIAQVQAGIHRWINGVSPPPRPLKARVLWHTLSHDLMARVLLHVPGPGGPLKTIHLHRESTRDGMCGGDHLSWVSNSYRWPRLTYWPRHCLYEGGISSRDPSFCRATYTHKLHTHVLGCLFARSIVNHCCGVHGIFLPWGKGLIWNLKNCFFSGRC